MSKIILDMDTEEITGQLAERIDAYVESLFVPHEEALAQNLRDAEAAGLPAINVSPNQGKLLYMMAKIARARRALELGTLGGYSTTWLARALPGDGKLITVERDASYAEVARKNLERAGVGALVEIRVGRAAELLQTMIANGESPFDLAFIDADKPGYVEYLNLVLQLSRPGTLILADNVIRNGLVADTPPGDANAKGAHAYNTAIASHPRLESIVMTVFRNKIDGMSVSIVK